jgi:hypothetical protein
MYPLCSKVEEDIKMGTRGPFDLFELLITTIQSSFDFTPSTLRIIQS